MIRMPDTPLVKDTNPFVTRQFLPDVLTEDHVKEGLIICMDKPLEWTSFNLVAKIKFPLQRRLHIKKLKVGHAGTLDPLATGVMIVCTGRATRRIEEFQYGKKEYIVTLRLGATTPSFDLEKEIDAVYPTDHITCEKVLDILPQFIGRIEQVPPAFSACKINGKKAYDLARAEKEVELKPKTLVIDEIELLACNLPVIQIRVVCSKGTYIRALARDIGVALQSGAHLTGLKRTQIGTVKIEDCLTIETFQNWLDRVLPRPFNPETINNL